MTPSLSPSRVRAPAQDDERESLVVDLVKRSLRGSRVRRRSRSPDQQSTIQRIYPPSDVPPSEPSTWYPGGMPQVNPENEPFTQSAYAGMSSQGMPGHSFPGTALTTKPEHEPWSATAASQIGNGTAESVAVHAQTPVAPSTITPSNTAQTPTRL